MTRQSVLLRQILSYFATPTQLREFDSLARKNKGASVHQGLRLIEKYFERKAVREKLQKYSEKLEIEEKPRGIKINSSQGSYFI